MPIDTIFVALQSFYKGSKSLNKMIYNQHKYNPIKIWSQLMRRKISKTYLKTIIIYSFIFTSVVLSASMIKSKFTNKSKPLTENEKYLLAELERIEGENQRLNNNFKKVEAALTEIEEKDRNIYRAIYDLKVNENIDAVNNEVNSYDSEKIQNLLNNISKESKSLDEVFKSLKSKDKILTSLPVLKPVSDKYMTRLASGFGTRFHPILKVNKEHKGLDFAANTGTPIYTTGDGVVTESTFSSGYGNMVKVKHNSTYTTLYAHMAKSKVKKGQKVKRGDVIGYVGSTGMSTGSHLHYEIHKNGTPVDPIMYFYNDVDPDNFIKIYQNAKNTNLSLD